MSRDANKSNSAADLAAIQRWLQAVITHPSGIEAGLADDEAQAEIPVPPDAVEEVILRSQNLTSVERLAVYGNAYYTRLVECLESMYPALVATLGEELFGEFAFAYLQQFPSQSYTLDRLADHFADFLESSRSELDEDSPSDLSRAAQRSAPSSAQFSAPSWPDFLIDLARFEHAIGEVFDGPGSEELPQLSPESLSAIPPDAWAAARLIPSPSLRLLTFRFPLNDYYTAARGGAEAPLPDPLPSYLALWRRNYVVRRLPLAHEQFTLLAEIVRGASIGDSLTAAAAVTDDFDRFAAALSAWFQEWAAVGFFIGLESSAHAPPGR